MSTKMFFLKLIKKVLTSIKHGCIVEVRGDNNDV